MKIDRKRLKQAWTWWASPQQRFVQDRHDGLFPGNRKSVVRGITTDGPSTGDVCPEGS